MFFIFLFLRLLGMNNSNKTPAVSPGAAPGWDPFGNNAQSNAQGIYYVLLACTRVFNFLDF